ncbi:hypothetical protein QQ008_26010 [Fulvivirgaceae bacterium BMA10]|uniref:YCII-related domain-containing protein n=1 Tax=Splendidivirga corallicola TaxID=3051826 RepID=A0ABT8KZ55_9BACT|nr:hypothetical protein [Fulvivirgaceae bacterium BMA10]
MKKFIAIYHAAPEAMAQMAEATPEQKAEGMKYWLAWKEKIGNALVDLGAPLVGGVAINPSGDKVNSSKQVSGYSIVQADDTEAAHALFDNHPHLSWHPTASIEIHECVEM